MPIETLRLLIDLPQPGVWNMAVDETLLESAAERGVATLRFYRWSEPTLSLGYFQAYADRERHAASAACPCVRRRSGGGAIVHDQELTYSLAAPQAQLPMGGAEALYRVVHQRIVAVLGTITPTVGFRLCEGEAIKRPPADEPFLCFQRRSAGDVLAPAAAGDFKVVGSAQRKWRGAVLQHGSVLVRRSAAAPELPGIEDLHGGGPLDGGSLAEQLAAELPPRLGAEVSHGELTAEESASAEQKRAERFGSPDWTRRR